MCGSCACVLFTAPSVWRGQHEDAIVPVALLLCAVVSASLLILTLLLTRKHKARRRGHSNSCWHGSQTCVSEKTGERVQLSKEQASSSLSLHYLTPLTNNGIESSHVAKASSLSLHYLTPLTNHGYGSSYVAKASGLPSSHSEPLVAVKTLDPQTSAEEKQQFLRQAEIISTLQHKNIVRMLARLLIADEPCIVLEYDDSRELTEYLRDMSHAISKQQQWQVCSDVASALLFLTNRRFVHRDVAARNCLVAGEGGTVKLHDFALMRPLADSEAYYSDGKEALPLRWMPLEAIMLGRFSQQSDVWSFGVFMWEVYSYGMAPYDGLSSQEVVSRLRQGQHLPSPYTAAADACELMGMCWKMKPEQRPTFSQLTEQFMSVKFVHDTKM